MDSYISNSPFTDQNKIYRNHIGSISNFRKVFFFKKKTVPQCKREENSKSDFFNFNKIYEQLPCEIYGNSILFLKLEATLGKKEEDDFTFNKI